MAGGWRMSSGFSLHAAQAESCAPTIAIWRHLFARPIPCRIGNLPLLGESEPIARGQQRNVWIVMPLQVVQYPHPALRHVSKPLKKIDAELRDIVREMFELMYKHNGVGLAANQVNLPYRVFVVNLESDPKKGAELAFINPVISRRKGLDEAEEGCLSLPGLYGYVKRPAEVVVDAFSLEGQPIHLELEGLLRVVQHETDHLDGRLFIDRLNATGELSRDGRSSMSSRLPLRVSVIEAKYPATKRSSSGWWSWRR